MNKNQFIVSALIWTQLMTFTGCAKSEQEQLGETLLTAIETQNCTVLSEICNVEYNDFYTQSDFFDDLQEAYSSTLIGSNLTMKDYEYNKDKLEYTLTLSDGQTMSLPLINGKFSLSCINQYTHYFSVPQNSTVSVNDVALGDDYLVTTANGYDYYVLNGIADRPLTIKVYSDITGEYEKTVNPEDFVSTLNYDPDEEEHFEEVPLNPDKVEAICTDLNTEVQAIFDVLQLDDCSALDLLQYNMAYTESQYNTWIDEIKENRQSDSEYTKYFDAISTVTLRDGTQPTIVAENTVSLTLNVLVSWAVGDGSLICKMNKEIPVTVRLIDDTWSLYEFDFLDMFILNSVTE